MPVRSLLKKLGMASLATVLALLLLNGLAFLGEVAAYGTWIRDDQPVGLYRHAEGERPQLKPGAHLRGLLYEVHISSIGFRGPELTQPKPANGLRLWCLGGSTTFDIYAPDDATTWPALTGQILQEQRPDRVVEVINAGIPGEIMEGSLADLEALGAAVQPDVVVVYHGPNDLRSVLAGGVPAPPPVRLLPTRWAPALYRVLQRQIQGRAWQRAALPPGELRPHQRQQLQERLRSLVRAARRLGAAPVLATHALRAAPDDQGATAQARVAEAALLLGIDAASTIRVFGQYNALVAEVARAEGVALADVRAAVPPDAAAWGDATHFRAPGSRLAAAAVAATVAEVVAPGRTPP